MCGIAGVVYRDAGQPVPRETLVRMARAILHRGPDDEGFWQEPGCGLAHRRLSILDLSAAGRQPMTNEDGQIRVVFNGEIYNFASLRRDLAARGHHFESQTDTEVIVHLYEEEGIDCVSHLEGMFALAIWDAPRRRLLLARDRVGKKPLKYAQIPGGLAFASELKSLLAAGLVATEIEPLDLDRYLSVGYVPAPGTGLKGIHKLPPAHRLVWEAGQCRLEQYWSLDFSRKCWDRSPSEWREAVRGAVRGAVERRLVADVPLGAFLSGGIDSSIVVACMARAGSGPVETFSIGFDYEARNELPHARRIAELYGTRHHEFVVKADSAALMPVLAELYEEPYADSSALPSYLLARETRAHVTVALNGDGGDEAFAGYRRYGEVLARGRRLKWPARLGARGLTGLALRARGLLPAQQDRRLDALHHALDPDLARRYAWVMRIHSEHDKRSLYGDAMRDAMASREPWFRDLERRMADPRAGRDPLDRMLWADYERYLPDDLLVKADLACMAHGLEARSPLLDPQVLELAASAPAHLKIRGGRLKHLLKEAFRAEIPSDLVDRRKQGFGIPVQEWFRGPLLPLARDLLLGSGARLHAFFRPPALEGLVEDHASGRDDRGYQLWSLAMLELWMRGLSVEPLL